MPQDNKIKIRRGLDANLPAFNTEIGELRYSTDTKKLYIDDGTANIYIAGDVNDFPISTATQTALNNKQDVLNYTPENSANKSDNYTASSSTTYASTKALVDGLATKLDKGTYVGTAQDLKNSIDSKANISHTHNISDVTNLQTTLNNKQDRLQNISGNIGVGKTDTSATEKLEVNGNVKATQIKDTYGTLKAQRCITITGNTTLSEIHNGAVLNVTNSCNITIPTGLDSNFQCVIFAKGSIVVTFVTSGVTIYAPSGLLLKQDKMASLICTGTNNYNLTGELATS